jgi:hypothetical protein
MHDDQDKGLTATTAVVVFVIALLVALAFVYLIDAGRM